VSGCRRGFARGLASSRASLGAEEFDADESSLASLLLRGLCARWQSAREKPDAHAPDQQVRSPPAALDCTIVLGLGVITLDEATSLDPRSARRLERSMAAVLAGRTVVAIAHRPHTGQDAEGVIVMADGQIRETGSHRELVEAGGPYAAL
jgi:ABC-type polar amino acid transport system ATPase subunit